MHAGNTCFSWQQAATNQIVHSYSLLPPFNMVVSLPSKLKVNIFIRISRYKLVSVTKNEICLLLDSISSFYTAQ